MRMEPIVAAGIAAPARRRESGQATWRGDWRRDWRGMALVLTIAAFVLRAAFFTNPIPGDDEQFYLLVGHRMLDGAIPYLDIWDRKPYGLFALFAGLAALGGDPILVATVIATLFAAGTAILVARIAARTIGPVPSIAAGILYLLMLNALAGTTVQTAVFYNMPVAAAAWLILHTGPALDRRGDLRRAALAMLLVGVAMTIKPMAAFQGAAFGVWLVGRLAHRGSPVIAVRRALLFMMLGLAPTAAIAIGYALAGQFDAWWFANFVSQLRKSGGFSGESVERLVKLLPVIVPLAGSAAWGLATMRSRDRGLLALWAGLAGVETFALGNFWPLYALPLAVPAAILTAQVFARPRIGGVIFALLCAWPLAESLVFNPRYTMRAQRTVAATMARIPADSARTCLFAYNVPEVFYLLTRACTVTPYLFIDQLRSAAEARALPIDAGIALRQALARRPGTILTMDHVHWAQPNRANDAAITRVLADRYRRIAAVPMETWPQHRETLIVWRRNDLPVR